MSTQLRGTNYIYMDPPPSVVLSLSEERGSHQTGRWKWSSGHDALRARGRGARIAPLTLAGSHSATSSLAEGRRHRQLHVHRHRQQHSSVASTGSLSQARCRRLDSQIPREALVVHWTRAAEGCIRDFSLILQPLLPDPCLSIFFYNEVLIPTRNPLTA